MRPQWVNSGNITLTRLSKTTKDLTYRRFERRFTHGCDQVRSVQTLARWQKVRRLIRAPEGPNQTLKVNELFHEVIYTSLTRLLHHYEMRSSKSASCVTWKITEEFPESWGAGRLAWVSPMASSPQSSATANGQRVRVDTRQRTPRLARVRPVVPHGIKTRLPTTANSQRVRVDTRQRTPRLARVRPVVSHSITTTHVCRTDSANLTRRSLSVRIQLSSGNALILWAAMTCWLCRVVSASGRHTWSHASRLIQLDTRTSKQTRDKNHEISQFRECLRQRSARAAGTTTVATRTHTFWNCCHCYHSWCWRDTLHDWHWRHVDRKHWAGSAGYWAAFILPCCCDVDGNPLVTAGASATYPEVIEHWFKEEKPTSAGLSLYSGSRDTFLSSSIMLILNETRALRPHRQWHGDREIQCRSSLSIREYHRKSWWKSLAGLVLKTEHLRTPSQQHGDREIW